MLSGRLRYRDRCGFTITSPARTEMIEQSVKPIIHVPVQRLGQMIAFPSLPGPRDDLGRKVEE